MKNEDWINHWGDKDYFKAMIAVFQTIWRVTMNEMATDKMMINKYLPGCQDQGHTLSK